MSSIIFVTSTPEVAQSGRNYELELSRIRSHAASVSHKARRKRKFRRDNNAASNCIRNQILFPSLAEDQTQALNSAHHRGDFDLISAYPNASLSNSAGGTSSSMQPGVENNLVADYPNITMEEFQAPDKMLGPAKRIRLRRKNTKSKKSNVACKALPMDASGRHRTRSCASLTLSRPHLRLHQDYQEGRSFQFYLERTSLECSGWHDYEFWSHYVPQAAASHSPLRHAIIALGAYHESQEAHSPSTSMDCLALCIEQGNKALECLRRHHEQMSLAAIISCYIIMTESAAGLGDTADLQTQRVLCDMMDEFRIQQARNPNCASAGDKYYISTYLEPLIEKQRSRAGHIIDPLHSLRNTCQSHFYVQDLPPAPESFDTLWQARQSLESLLNWTTYTVKAGSFAVNQLPRASEVWFEQWLASLQKFQDVQALSRMDLSTLQILRATSKIALIMIRTMDTDDEMIFDQYEDEYREFTSAASCFVACNENGTKKTVRFGIDAGFLCYVGWVAQRLCRDPHLRGQLINVLRTANRREGLEGSGMWALICRRIQMEEEAGINPPPSRCYDIPAENRLRVHEGAHYLSPQATRVTVLQPPYDETRNDDKRHLWIFGSTPLMNGPQEQRITRVPEDTEPQIILGKGWMSFRSQGTSGIVKARRFQFPMPRL